jgi:hypothetical protein
MEYMLEIYEPGSEKEVWVHFESSSPFMPIAVGDYLNPYAWDPPPSPLRILRVVRVEHLIWNISVLSQKILIFTEFEEGTREQLE